MTNGDLKRELLSQSPNPVRCAVCGIPAEKLVSHRFHGGLEMAHIISRARAGKAGQRIENVLLLCASCHGAQHNSNYTYNNEVWPDLTEWHLMLAKMDADALDTSLMAELAGWTEQFVIEEILSTRYPDRIAEERDRWIPLSYKNRTIGWQVDKGEQDASSRVHSEEGRGREAEGEGHSSGSSGGKRGETGYRDPR